MAKLRIPSLQHLARNWRETPAMTQKGLVNLAKNPPTFSYNPIYGAVEDMLIFNQPYDEIVAGISRKIHRTNVRENFLELLPLIRNHFDGVVPDYVQAMNRSYYPAGQGLLIPFEPPLIYGIGGQVIFPWFSFWRSNPLAEKRLSLFITVVEEILLQDPDLENAKFQILDFSIPGPKQPRELLVINADEIPRLPSDEKTHMLSVFAEGFLSAQAELAGIPDKKRKSAEQEERPDPNQQSLF